VKIVVAITFHYREEKLPYLIKVLKSIATISAEQLKVIISTNQPFDLEIANLDLELDVVERLYHPFFLAWCHKRYMLQFLDSDNTHFIYLEDDIEITPQTVDYWVRTRELFLRNNLNFIPAILRVEYDSRGNAYAVDCVNSVVESSRPGITVEGQKFVSLESPYQAMFIMDRALVKEHTLSRSFRYETATPFQGAWLVQDLAAQGNMFENVPKGFEHRYLIPVNNQTEAWVHHNTDTYVNIPDSPHGKLPAEFIIV
jgi:hypothetical protein